MKISTGTPEDHPTPLPLDSSATPGVVGATPRFPPGTEQGGVRDTTGERISQLADSQADAAAAMTAGMQADSDRRGRYESAMLPLGASYGDEMTLPAVPEQATTPSNDFLYPQGDQPGA